MPTRNTAILREIVDVLSRNLISPESALTELERHFSEKLLTIAGDTQLIDQQAQELRLAITTQEARQVLDYIAEKNLASVSIETHGRGHQRPVPRQVH